MAPTTDPDQEERLKAALWYSIGRITDHESLAHNANATPQFIGALTELVWTQISTAAKDLESFAKHAGRSVVNTEDVLLLARRNEGLQALLRRFVDDYRAEEGGGNGRGDGRN